MTIAHEYLVSYRQQDLMREAEHARLARCIRPRRPWRRADRRRCA